ncbi:MAG: TonB-dependent receptor [candidate division KSB1 bacterium]|nr:TonB-dependent receptor [candidate division KSB1 bacterium]MDZ7300750.1 TonB-dependent receptor [candidate division KSB1 bacterium]
MLKKQFTFLGGAFAISSLCWCGQIAHAQPVSSSRGVIAGTVQDQKTRELLPGTNIMVEGTTLGAASDIDGRFLIRGVPAGTYRLQASLLGYVSAIAAGVKVVANETTRVDLKLTVSAIEMPEVVVTATKKAQSFMESPVSLSVVSARQIQDQNQVQLDDVLEFTPGVNMMGGQINIRGSSGFSRGAGSRVLLLVDGVPMLPGDSGDIKWDALPPSEIDHVEIVKGASSALYGSYAMGGVVNVITKDPGDRPQTNIRATGGIYDKPYYKDWDWTDRTLTYNNQDISHSRAFGNLKIRASLGRRESTGYSENGHYHRFSGYTKAKYIFSPTSYLTAYANYAHDRHGEALTWLDTNHPFQVSPDATGYVTTSSKLQAGGTFRSLLNSRTTLKLRGSYYRNTIENDLADPRVNPFCQQSGTHIEVLANKGELETQLDLELADGHATTLGAVGIFDFIDATLYGNHNSWDGAAYLQHEWKPNSIISSVGSVRFDYHWVDTGLIEYHLNPKFGLVYTPTSSLSLRASSGRGFRAATMAEMFTCTQAGGFTVIPNPNLSSEIAWSHEVGAQFIAAHFLVNSALFWNEYQDLIEGDFVTKRSRQVIQFQNFNRARIRGAEVEINGALWKRHLNFGVGYTYLDARELERRDSQTGESRKVNDPLAYRARHLLTGNVTLSLGRFSLGADSRYASRIEAVRVYPNDPRVSQKVTNLRFGADFKPLTLMLNIYNVFQYNYTQVERTMEPIRSFALTTALEL